MGTYYTWYCPVCPVGGIGEDQKKTFDDVIYHVENEHTGWERKEAREILRRTLEGYEG